MYKQFVQQRTPRGTKKGLLQQEKVLMFKQDKQYLASTTMKEATNFEFDP